MIWLIIIIPIAVYCIAALILTLFQSKFIFIPGKTIFRTPNDMGMKFEDIFINSEKNDEFIHAWLIKAEKPKGTLLFCHGNAGTMSHRLESAEIYISMGLDVMMFDYRGYGKSSSSPSEKNTYEDAQAVWKYLIERGIEENKIIILGRSLGGPIAANLAKDHNSAMLIIESTFTSVHDVAKKRFPFFPVKLLVKRCYPTLDYIRAINVPLLVIHSRNDEIIPFSMGEKLFDAANDPKSFLEMRGSHNETYFECIDIYRKQLEKHVKQYLL